MLPFSRDQFFEVFARYNEAVWPAQLALLALGAACAGIVLARRGRDEAVGWALATLWAWLGVAYHFAFFTRINGAAWAFGAASLVAAWLFARHAMKGTLTFGWPGRLEGAAGVALALYALGGYPLVAFLAGHAYPNVPTFGLPCPTTIFTLGMLLLAKRPVPAVVFVVPLAWSAVGSVAAFQLGVVEDLGLLAAGVVTAAVLAARGGTPVHRTPASTRA